MARGISSVLLFITVARLQSSMVGMKNISVCMKLMHHNLGINVFVRTFHGIISTRYTTTPNDSNTNNEFQKYSANTQIKQNHLIAFKYP